VAEFVDSHQYVNADSRQEIAHILVEREAVKFSTDPLFRFTSGVESPIYVDNRRLIGFVKDRERIVTALANLASRVVFQAIAGTATAGIPWAAWLAHHVRVPLLYVRPKVKDWGGGKAVEGFASSGSTVLVVEDLITTSGSLCASTENLRALGYTVNDCVTIVTYRSAKAEHRLRDVGVKAVALTDIDQTIEIARKSRLLPEDQFTAVVNWLHTTFRHDEANPVATA